MRIGINLKIAAESFLTAELAIQRMNEYSYAVFVCVNLPLCFSQLKKL